MSCLTLGAVKEQSFSERLNLVQLTTLSDFPFFIFHLYLLDVIASVGDTGDASIVPDMAMYLKDPSMQDPVETALWAIFHRHANPSVTEFMNQVFFSKHHSTPGLNESAAYLWPEIQCAVSSIRIQCVVNIPSYIHKELYLDVLVRYA